MRLSWKDGITTVLIGLAVAIALAVTQSWGWPLLGSYRTGVLVLAAVGLAACAVGGLGAEAVSKEEPAFRGGFGAVARVVHGVALGLVVYGLIVPSRVALLALVGDIVALWIVGTVHHAVQGGPMSGVGRSARPGKAVPGLT